MKSQRLNFLFRPLTKVAHTIQGNPVPHKDPASTALLFHSICFIYNAVSTKFLLL